MKKLLKIELHVHTLYSNDSWIAINNIIRVAKKMNLDKIAITDHNTISGALIAKNLYPDLIIIGEEIMTEGGEIIGYFLEKEIPSGLSPAATISLLREQNAFIVIPHPFDHHRHGWDANDLKRILSFVDALEVFNSRSIHSRYNVEALSFATENNIPQVVGSDAHTVFEIGKSTLSIPEFNNSDDFRMVINQAIPNVKKSPVWVHLFSSIASIRHLIRQNR